MENNNNLRFQLLRIRRLFIVILGRAGLWELCYKTIDGMMEVMERIERIKRGR